MIMQTDIKNKVLNGCRLAIERLLEQKSKTNSNLAISDNGKGIKVKAADLMQSFSANKTPAGTEAATTQHQQ